MDQQQLARIRLLSRRFLELQGLRLALAGSAIAVVMGGFLITMPAPTREGAMTAMLAAIVLMTPGQWWLHRYYATTFGRQVQKPGNPRLILPALSLNLAVFTISMYLNRRFPEIPAGAPTTVFFGFLTILVAMRDWPWRGYYLGITGVVAVAFTASLLTVGDSGTTLAMTFFALGVSAVPVGLLDHRLLVRLIEQARPHQVAVTANRQAD